MCRPETLPAWGTPRREGREGEWVALFRGSPEHPPATGTLVLELGPVKFWVLEGEGKMRKVDLKEPCVFPCTWRSVACGI